MVGFEPRAIRGGFTPQPGHIVEVYRNVSRRDGVWYSVRWAGHVLGHAREVTLGSSNFIVGQAGRRRVINTGVKNVHAYVRGVMADDNPPFDLPVSYNPKTHVYFRLDNEAPVWIHQARGVHLGSNGVSVREPVLTGLIR